MDAFSSTISFKNEEDRLAFNQADHILDWLGTTREFKDHAPILTAVVLPAILSDTLHCIYEALQASKYAKLNITFMLIRKPIQENLFVLESMLSDGTNFAEKLTTDPMKLRGLKLGGIEQHAQHIQKVLAILGEDRISAAYLAQLRYSKTAEDGFDGICNLAMHLFTEHPAIRTDPLNINLIFSDWEAKATQWSYLYSRLPYIMFYLYRLVEKIMSTITPTHPDYLEDMERRISAATLLWWNSIEDDYTNDELEELALKTGIWLENHCAKRGNPIPKISDLKTIRDSGKFFEFLFSDEQNGNL